MQENKKGAWSEEEDMKLKNFLENEGGARGLNWDTISQKAGLKRCGKSCRLRWKNYLSPHIKRGNFTPQEEEIIIRLQSQLGNKWAQIAAQLPGRTDNDIKNLWNTKLRRQLQHKQLHYNLFSDAIAEAASNALLLQQSIAMELNQEYYWSVLQTMDPLLTSDIDAWSDENALDSNVGGYNYNYNTLPALVSPTDHHDHHQNPLEIAVNGIGNEMDCELLTAMGVQASTSNNSTYGGSDRSYLIVPSIFDLSDSLYYI